MVSHLLYYQLALLALVWLFIMLHLTWPTPGVTAPAALAEPEPITPKRPRFHEPKAFVCTRYRTAQNAAASAARPHGTDEPTPPHRGHLDALLSPYRLSLSRLAGAEQPAIQWPSSWRPVAAISLYLMQWLFPRTSWHDFPWQTGVGGTYRTRLGLPGRGLGYPRHRPGV